MLGKYDCHSVEEVFLSLGVRNIMCQVSSEGLEGKLSIYEHETSCLLVKRQRKPQEVN